MRRMIDVQVHGKTRLKNPASAQFYIENLEQTFIFEI